MTKRARMGGVGQARLPFIYYSIVPLPPRADPPPADNVGTRVRIPSGLLASKFVGHGNK